MEKDKLSGYKNSRCFALFSGNYIACPITFGKPGPKQSMRKASVSGRRWHFPQSRLFWISGPSPVFFHLILPPAYRLPTSFQTGLFFVEASPGQVIDDSGLFPFFQTSLGSCCILLNVLPTHWETSAPFDGLASVEGSAARSEGCVTHINSKSDSLGVSLL